MRGIYKMLNKVGREIPEEILKQTGKEVFQGNYYKDNTEFQKQGPITKVVMNHDTSKMVSSIHEALVKCGAHDGMTLGFHHHFRDGDLVVNMVMQEVHNLLQGLLRFILSGYILKRNTGLFLHINLGFVLADTHNAASAASHLAHQQAKYDPE